MRCATVVLCMLCVLSLLMNAHILTVEELYTEISVTTFMIFWILVQILWKNSIDFYVFIVLFIIPLLGTISNVRGASRK